MRKNPGRRSPIGVAAAVAAALTLPTALTLATACSGGSDPASPTSAASASTGSGTASGAPAPATGGSATASPSGTLGGAAAVTAPGAAPSRARPPAKGWWRPGRGVSWQWQLSGSLDLSVNVQVYDVDLFTTSAAQIQALHARGRKVICYLNACAYEPYRPDSATVPKTVLGKTMDGWPDERWLDVRRLDLLEPIMAARLDLCRAKGFDGVEPDNVEGYANESGFPLTAADQLRYNRWLAGLAHARGLAIGLKNDLDQAAALQPSFDFAVNEECMQYGECPVLSVFITANKPVLHVEYDLAPGAFCSTARKLGFSSMRKSLDLGAARTPC